MITQLLIVLASYFTIGVILWLWLLASEWREAMKEGLFWVLLAITPIGACAWPVMLRFVSGSWRPAMLGVIALGVVTLLSACDVVREPRELVCEVNGFTEVVGEGDSIYRTRSGDGWLIDYEKTYQPRPGQLCWTERMGERGVAGR